MGREGAVPQLGWGGRSTTGERGSSSYGDGEVVPPLGSEGGEAPQSGQVRASRMAGRMGEAACGSRAEWSGRAGV